MSKEELLDWLCESYEKRLKYLREKKNHAIDEEDILQETFLNAYMNLWQLRNGNVLLHWIGTIRDNLESASYRDKEKQRRFQDLKNTDLLQEEEYADKNFRLYYIDNHYICMNDLIEKLSVLGPKEKKIFFLYFIEGRKCSEIAEITGIKHNTVKSILMRLKIKLKKAIEDENDV